MIKSLPELMRAMKSCYQFEGIDMVEHGKMVNIEYMIILKGWRDNDLPEQLVSIIKQSNKAPSGLVTKYHIMHDCGKPLCRVVSDDGKVHYPDHATVSANQMKYLFPDEHDLHFLIESDMDFHIKKTPDLVELSNHKYGLTLYITAWAELFANASMFGGTDSVSYKIKKKRLLKHVKLFLGRDIMRNK